MCEEREGEEGRGAGQNALSTRSCVEVTGGIFSAFLGQKMLFCPKNTLRIPPKLLSIKLGRWWVL